MRRVALVAIVGLAALLRLLSLDLSPFHDVDDIRDWTRAERVAQSKEPWWLGPDAAISTGRGARLPGGLYYQLLAGAYRIHRSPLSGIALTALMGVVAVGLTIPLSRLLLPGSAALLVGLIAATSPGWVLAGRRIWNPNLLPFFSSFFYWGFLLWFLRSSRMGFVMLFGAAGLLAQLHLSSLALVPLMMLAVFSCFRKPRLLLLALLAFLLPLSTFFIQDARHGWSGSSRLRAVVAEVVAGREGKSSEGLPKPVCWPLPYLPPLGSCSYSDDTIDRTVAALLVSDSSKLEGNALLGIYWKRGLGKLIRSFDICDLPSKARAHGHLPPGMKARFWVDTLSSLFLTAAVLLGLLGLLKDSIGGERRARLLLLLAIPCLVTTLISGVSGAYHFYFVFFPIPALIAVRGATSFRRLRRGMVMGLVAAALLNAGLLLDRRIHLEELGGTPEYGVPYRYRRQATQWLQSQGVQGVRDIKVIGAVHPWQYSLHRGGTRPRFLVIEPALGQVCGEEPMFCGATWLRRRAQWKKNLRFIAGSIWICEIPGAAESGT